MSVNEKYNVYVTAFAREQIKETADYISHALMEPQTARKWLDTMEKEISSLSFMPNRIPFTPEEPWHSEGVHRMRIKNFYAYFRVNEEEKTVWITAVIYVRRNQREHLKEAKEKNSESGEWR